MTMSDYYVHQSSVIDDGAVIGVGTKIWHFCHISSSAIIGANCILGQNVYIGPNVRIGDGVKVQNNVSVYEGVILEDEVFIGPSVVFTNVLEPRAYLERKDQFLKTLVKSRASIGANSTIICGNTIGSNALIGAGSVVTQDIPDKELWFGNPAKLYKSI
jgi:UDP-2-acetamido-3-amino-2,3-dideoxy-glucuronate N-acetyltransferase